MMRTLNRLPAAHLRRLSDGMHADGGGLYLRVRDSQRAWLLRYQLQGRAREMGLGTLSDVSLATARELAAEARKLLALGQDPLEARRHALAASASIPTFKQAAEAFLADREGSWQGARVRDQWANTLARYANPVIGGMPVSTIQVTDVLRVLRPIWKAKPETANRVRGRIENILDWATAQHMRSGPNPAVWRGTLSAILPATTRLATTRHHPALPYAELAAFMEQLRNRRGIAAQALRFAVLTAARTAEVLGATWDEIDWASKLWIIPATRMKAGKDHRVPLSDAATAVIEDMAKLRLAGSPLVFPGEGRNGRLSDMSLRRVLLRMKRTDITAHGFRSTFRDWAAEQTSAQHEVCEACLAHAPSSAVVAAYRRGDMLEKRRQLMDTWASYCEAPVGDNVIKLKTAAA
jgi:integrase